MYIPQIASQKLMLQSCTIRIQATFQAHKNTAVERVIDVNCKEAISHLVMYLKATAILVIAQGRRFIYQSVQISSRTDGSLGASMPESRAHHNRLEGAPFFAALANLLYA